MTPFSFEWQWNIDYFIFMGLLYLALGIVGCGLAVAYIRAWLQTHEEEKGLEKGAEEISTRTRYSEY